MHKPCLSCGDIFSGKGSRCASCASLYEAEVIRPRRGSTASRGYGSVWQRLSQSILERDGYRCYLCGDWANTVDHLVPKAAGGSDDPTNLAACCRPCNSAKGARK